MAKLWRIAFSICISSVVFVANAAELDTIGVTLLRSIDPTLMGDGVAVAQAESSENVEGTAWQVNPFAIGQPTNLFTYISADGSASNYPNSLGTESGHANLVGRNFYGASLGTAPGVAHVDNYEASYFYNSRIIPGISIQPRIVNQSFIFGPGSQTTVDTLYDNYAVQNNVLFVSGLGNSGPPNAPATAYNGIGVAVFEGFSSVGPTTDNGRSKPDITAPGGATSFSTPYVAGSAAILRQAGLRGDGGIGTTSSSADIRTIKALLLNGAIKPSNWTHTATAPLDTRFGAGILNVFNSYQQLAGGEFNFIESALTGTVGGAHLPGNNPTNVASLAGWDFNTIAASVNSDRVNHYYFSLPTNMAKVFTLTATLVWNRGMNASDPANLDLFLYQISNSNLVASSVSSVDNVEHLYVTNLPAGRYDLQVLKKGGVLNMGTETYALAFESFALPLSVTRSSESQLCISWPIAPTGFTLQSTANLESPVSWTAVTNVPVVRNSQNRVTLSAPVSAQFFRLIRP